MLVFAGGYDITFGLIEPPSGVDMVLIAPRMIGAGVRDTYLSGEGFPSLVAVHQAATGAAFERMPALCQGIGPTRMGVIESSFLAETTVDLFAEQVGHLYAAPRYCEALVEAGCSPEAAILKFLPPVRESRPPGPVATSGSGTRSRSTPAPASTARR